MMSIMQKLENEEYEIEDYEEPKEIDEMDTYDDGYDIEEYI